MKETMRASVLTAPYQVECQTVEKPSPKADEVLIRVKYCGICGSELHAYFGLHKKRVPPVVMGHEFSGTVEAVGSTVTKYKVGDRVTALPMFGCGHCEQCKAGEVSLCANKVILGSQIWPGAFGEYITAREDLVYGLPDGVSMEDGALVEPLAVGLHGVRIAEVKPGDSVAVLGAGTIGLCTVMMAQSAGAVPLIATDVQPFNLEMAKKYGATNALDSRSETLIEDIQQITDGGCDVVLITAPVPALMSQAIKMVRKRGKIIVIAMYDKEIPLDVEMNRVKQSWISGSSMYYPSDFGRVIRMLEHKTIDTTGLVTGIHPLEMGGQCYEMMKNHHPGTIKLLLTL